MRITCSKAELFKGIQTVQNIVSTKTTLPILSHILMEAKDNQLRLASTDLETGIECLIPVKVIEKGGITVPARKIGEIVRDLPDAEVNLTVKDQTITLDCEKGVFKISGLEREDFPEIPQLAEKRSFVLKQEILKGMLKKTSFAVSHDETRYALNGIFFVIKDNKLKLVATDGRRLAYVERKVKMPPGLEGEVIVPTKAANEISRILDEGSGELKIVLGDNQIAFHLDNIKLISRLIEGHFPDYQKVIPKKCKEKVIIKREPFLSALKRVSVLTSEKANSVRFDISQNKILLSTTASEIGEAKEELDLDYAGEEIGVAFNPVYMLDFLKNEEEENIYLEVTDSLSPGLMRPDISGAGKSNEQKSLYVIMPMKL